MNAYEAHERLETLAVYTEALHKAYLKLSNWNDEFGEGNPDASVITDLIKELEEEKDDLIMTMENTTLFGEQI